MVFHRYFRLPSFEEAPYLRVDSKHRQCDSEQCRKRKEWVLKIKTHAEDVTATLFKNLDIHRYDCNGAIVKVVPIIFIKELNKKLILQTGSTNSLRTQPEQLQVYPSISKCYQLIAKICLWTHNSGFAVCCGKKTMYTNFSNLKYLNV